MKIVRLGYLPIKKSLASDIYAVISLKGISPTIVCAGGGGNTDCFCIELTRVRRSVLRKERTEEGRRMRKAYESKEIGYSGGMRMAVPRTDGLCNTITTVTKDNGGRMKRVINQHMGGWC